MMRIIQIEEKIGWWAKKMLLWCSFLLFVCVKGV